MGYAAPSDLLAWFGSAELGDVGSPDEASRVVSPVLMRLTIEGGDRSNYSPSDVAHADAALVVIQTAIDDAGRQMDTYLARRYNLPLTDEVVAASPLPRICGDIARHMLMRKHPSDEVIARREAADRWLRDLATGRADLPVEPETGAGATVGSPIFTAPTRIDLTGF